MKYLGVDYGSHTIGLAVSDVGGGFAFARGTIGNDEGALKALENIIHEEQIGKIVMGDTRTLAGGSNTITSEAETFARALEQRSRVPVDFVREAWSSYEAARYAPDSHHDDSAAAAIILQRYLDMHASSGTVQGS